MRDLLIFLTYLGLTFGSSGTRVQLSDGTGTTDHPAIYASDGSVTDGPAGFTGSCASTTTLTVVKGIITGCS